MKQLMICRMWLEMFRIFFENLQEIHDISRVCFFKVPTQGLRMKKPYDLSSHQSRMHTIKITFGTKKIIISFCNKTMFPRLYLFQESSIKAKDNLQYWQLPLRKSTDNIWMTIRWADMTGNGAWAAVAEMPVLLLEEAGHLHGTQKKYKWPSDLQCYRRGANKCDESERPAALPAITQHLEAQLQSWHRLGNMSQKLEQQDKKQDKKGLKTCS